METVYLQVWRSPVAQPTLTIKANSTAAFLWSLRRSTSVSCGFTSHLTQNSSFQIRSSQPISWLGTEKLKQTQQKQTCIHNKIYYNLKVTKKTKATFSRGLLASYDIRPGNGEGLLRHCINL